MHSINILNIFVIIEAILILKCFFLLSCHLILFILFVYLKKCHFSCIFTFAWNCNPKHHSLLQTNFDASFFKRYLLYSNHQRQVYNCHLHTNESPFNSVKLSKDNLWKSKIKYVRDIPLNSEKIILIW